MPWTIPNLILHDKPVRLANMQSLGRNHVFVNCGNPDCYHNAELDVSRFPDDMTFSDLQPRMLCTVCDHRGADAGHPDHLKVFANPVAADEWFKANDPKGAAFEYEVLEGSPAAILTVLLGGCVEVQPFGGQPVRPLRDRIGVENSPE